MAECSAAWILGIPVFSLTMFVPISELPAFTSTFQALSIETPEGVENAIFEIQQQINNSQMIEYTWTRLYGALLEIEGQLREKFVEPDVVVGSGKGGAICGAFLAARRGVRLKVCDLRKGHTLSLDWSSLSEEDIAHKHILIVEYLRNTGKTFESIRDHVNSKGAKDVTSASLLCVEEQVGAIDFYAEKVHRFIRPPWQHNA